MRQRKTVEVCLTLCRHLDELTREIEDKQQQLELLDSLLVRATDSDQSTYLSGRPVNRKGWISSPYGRRIDPFTGKQAWHQGIDFATGRTGVWM